MIRPRPLSWSVRLALLAPSLLALAQTPITPTPATPSPATPSIPATNTPATGLSNTSTNTPATGTNGPASSTDLTQIDPETRELRPRDSFRYRIHEDPVGGVDSLRATITDSGEALFNVTRGDATYVAVKASGRRIAEVREELRKKLEADFYVVATIDLTLESIALPQGGSAEIGGITTPSSVPSVIVFDQLQGEFAIPDGQRLMLSTVMLKLPNNPYANRRKVEVQRVGPDGAALPPIIVNVEDLLLKNDRSKDVELKAGDRIRVPRKVIFGL